MVAIMEGAEAFSFEGGDVGVLVLHPFTGTPQIMRHLGEGLHRQFGFTISAPLLPGHGTSPDDLETIGYLDWLAAAERELQNLAERKRKVFVVGLSLGGVLALNFACRFPALVSGIVPIAANAGIFLEALAELALTGDAPARVPALSSAIKAPGVKELAYSEIPVASVRSAYVLAAATSNLLHKIVCPTLVIHAREDPSMPPANAMRIVNSISSDDVRLLWLNNSYHYVTLDNDKKLVLQRTGDFFSELARS